MLGAVNLNLDGAVSHFGIYEIEVFGEVILGKVGKTHMGRTTKSTGLPTRLHQQVRVLSEKFGPENVRARMVIDLGETTTRQAKVMENMYLQEIYDATGEVPMGNRRSFVPKKKKK